MPSLPDNSPLWLTIVVLAFMAVMVYLQTRNTSKVGSADATSKIGGAYDQLLENLQEQITVLKADLTAAKADMREMKKEIAKYINWTARLVKQLSEHGIAPEPPPDTGELKGQF